MKKIIRKFIASAVCEGIEQYVSKHRFGMNHMIEMVPLTHDEFAKHLLKNMFGGNEDAVRDYLSRNTPATEPQVTQNTK